MKRDLSSLRPSTRRLVQLYSALLHNAHLKGFITGQIYQGKGKFLCTPGLNCYSCPGAAGACPLGALQNALASAGHRAGWYVLGILLLFGVTLGRTICGWLCPAGLIQELLHKIPTPKLRRSSVTRALTRVKYVILAVFVIALPLWYGLRDDLPLPAFCKYICPAGTLEGAGGLLASPANESLYGLLGVLFTRKFVIMLVIGLACVFCYRSFCRFLCPLGALYGLFNRFALVGVRVDENRCTGCGTCVNTCRMDVRKVGDHECIHCGQCMAHCAQGAISVRAGRIILKAPPSGCAEDGPDAAQKRVKRGRVLWGAALCVLCAALVWFNFLDPGVAGGNALPVPPAETETPAAPPAETETPAAPAETPGPGTDNFESDAPEGREVGERLPDFTLLCYDGQTFRLSDCRGKAVFINFWATYCAPCKQELPYFSELYRAHEGDIAMIAVHPSLITDDPEEYLADKGYLMPFATDADDRVCGLAGNTGVLPQTIVLNRKGEVIYNHTGSVTPEALEALFAQATE